MRSLMLRTACTQKPLSRLRNFTLKRAFTLLEILLATVLLATLIGVAAYNFNSLSENAQYKEAKENLKTLIVSHRHKAAYDQKTVEVDLNQITNELNIVDASKIVFFSDGSVEESYIIVSSLDGKYTNKLIINIIGYVSESSDIDVPVIESEDRLPLENYEEAF
jgi:prepilin-type N-terminal cleavage/methylation domain-containing protein